MSMRSMPHPAACRKKVNIIDEVHMLTKEAFNALLKTLEEPPSHVLFILATTEPEKIPLTILSRCQRYEFHRSSVEDIKQHLLYISQKMPLTSSLSALMAVSEMHSPSLTSARLQPKQRRSTLQKSMTFLD